MVVRINPFDDVRFASHYEQWYAGRGRRAATLEKRLLGKLLAGFPNARTALEIGCGTGYFTRWLASRGLEVVGLDSSLPMLREARRREDAPLVLGDALDLPFSERSFDLVVFVTSLEFVAGHALALIEASRVARCGLLLGVLNRWSLTTLSYRLSGRALWRSAHFFSLPQLRRLIRSSLENRVQALRWRTTLWPLPGIGDLPLPWGGFIGFAVHLADRVLPAVRREAR
jgi:ubiquinone/menaquinone biosynthesis C-methylase UbiE